MCVGEWRCTMSACCHNRSMSERFTDRKFDDYKRCMSGSTTHYMVRIRRVLTMLNQKNVCDYIFSFLLLMLLFLARDCAWKPMNKCENRLMILVLLANDHHQWPVNSHMPHTGNSNHNNENDIFAANYALGTFSPKISLSLHCTASSELIIHQWIVYTHHCTRVLGVVSIMPCSIRLMIVYVLYQFRKYHSFLHWQKWFSSVVALRISSYFCFCRPTHEAHTVCSIWAIWEIFSFDLALKWFGSVVKWVNIHCCCRLLDTIRSIAAVRTECTQKRCKKCVTQCGRSRSTRARLPIQKKHSRTQAITWLFSSSSSSFSFLRLWRSNVFLFYLTLINFHRPSAHTVNIRPLAISFVCFLSLIADYVCSLLLLVFFHTFSISSPFGNEK